MAAIVFCAISAGAVEAQSSTSEPTSAATPSLNVVTNLVKEWLVILGALVTTAAAVVGGFLAWRNAQIFRAKSPHVTITHKVSHREIGDSYVHIFVTAVLHNSSRVHIEFLDGFASIRQIRPVSDEDVEYLYGQVFVEQDFAYLQWPDLDVLRHRWDRNGLLVEPGEAETEIFDFVVNRDVESVAIATYFYNSRVVGRIPADVELNSVVRPNKKVRRWMSEPGPLGWGRRTVYDIFEPR